MGRIDQKALQLSVQRALLFNIIPIVRFIFIEIDTNSILKLLIYLKNEPSNEEKDIYYAVAGEISGDFSEIDDSKNEVQFIVGNSKFEDIQKLEFLVFAMYEIS